MNRILFFVFLVLTQFYFAQQKKIPIIFDSDMGPDYDDVGAIAILHSYADSGYVNILAICASTKYEGVAGVMNVFNTYFGRPGILIGVPKGNASIQKDPQKWTDFILANYPHSIKNNNEANDAVSVYRKALASQANNSVTIVTVGFLTNLAGLLNSQADEYSPLSGLDLIKDKVAKLVCMAGQFPNGKEFNLFTDSEAAKIVFENWPSEIIFNGFEIGVNIKSGLPLIKNKKINHSPIKDVFSICIPKSISDSLGRMSWDEVAVIIAVKGYKEWYNVEHGKIIVEDDGSNSWDKNKEGHYYIVPSAPFPKIETYINQLIQHQPNIKKTNDERL